MKRRGSVPSTGSGRADGSGVGVFVRGGRGALGVSLYFLCTKSSSYFCGGVGPEIEESSDHMYSYSSCCSTVFVVAFGVDTPLLLCLYFEVFENLSSLLGPPWLLRMLNDDNSDNDEGAGHRRPAGAVTGGVRATCTGQTNLNLRAGMMERLNLHASIPISS